MIDKDKPTKNWEEIIGETSENPAEEAGEAAAVAEPVNGVLDHPDYKELEDKLTLAEQKAHENWDKAVRAMSELDNVRRQAENQTRKSVNFANEKIMKELLPVIDSLEQALLSGQQAEAVMASMIEGIDLTIKMLLSCLEKFGLKQIDPVGEVFDPHVHEAMAMTENAEVAPNTILSVFQKGYILHDRVIRPARVVVAKSAGA